MGMLAKEMCTSRYAYRMIVHIQDDTPMPLLSRLPFMEMDIRPYILPVVSAFPTMAPAPQRPLKGSRISTFYPIKSIPPLSTLDSAFQLQEYISLTIRLNIHDVSAIVSIPDSRSNTEGVSDDGLSDETDGDKDAKPEFAVDEACWIYEQLRYA